MLKKLLFIHAFLQSMTSQSQAMSRRTTEERDHVKYNGQTLCHSKDIFNGSWVFEAEEASSYALCPKAEYVSKTIDEASYLCKSYRAAEFNRDDGCTVLSFESLSAIFREHLGGKELVYIGDSLGTQQYLAALCDMEKVNSTLQINFIGEATFLPDIPCDTRCGDDGGVFLRHWLKVHPRLCLACPNGKPTIYTKENVTDSWMKKLNISQTGVAIFNSGVWYNWLHGYGRFPVHAFDSTTVYKTMLEYITLSMAQLVRQGIRVYWISIPTIPHNDGNRKKLRKAGEYEYYSSKNDLARKAVEAVGAIFLNIADVTHARRLSDESITIDGYHWCNPGRTAITSFINQAIYHLVAVDILKSGAKVY
jgi:hypothetical protein